jgi:hypothetical protein
VTITKVSAYSNSDSVTLRYAIVLQTADKEPVELYGNGIIMMIMVVVKIMIMSLFGVNQVLVYATCEV